MKDIYIIHLILVLSVSFCATRHSKSLVKITNGVDAEFASFSSIRFEGINDNGNMVSGNGSGTFVEYKRENLFYESNMS